MIRITDGKWIADLGAMMCRNIENGIVVSFIQKDKILEGKLLDMPLNCWEHGRPYQTGNGK
jgi:hypothetical protein